MVVLHDAPMKTNRIPILLTALGLTALAPIASGAETVGPPLPAPSTTNLCSGGVDCTYIGGTPSAPLNPVTSDGVITRWRLQSGSAGAAVTLRVLRPASGALRAISSSAPLTSTAGTDEAATRLTVRRGDILGISNSSSALLFGPVGTGSTTVFSGAVTDGQPLPAVVTLPGQTGVVPLLQAVVELDADGDGFGDETQDQCLGDRTRQTTPCRPAFSITPLVRPATVTMRQARTPVIVTTTLSRSASLRITVTALRPGRRVGTVCAPRDIQLAGASCQASVLVRQASRNAAAGAARIPVNLRSLAAGRYLVRVEATDREGSGLMRARQAIVTIRR